MRNETLLKIIIAVFAIILVILGTFAYGNYVRSKQTKQANNTQPSVEKPAETPAPAQAPANTSANSQTPHQPAATPATQAVPATAAQPAKTPATGAAQDGVVGATVLAVAAYLYVKSRKAKPAVSKSDR